MSTSVAQLSMDSHLADLKGFGIRNEKEKILPGTSSSRDNFSPERD